MGADKMTIFSLRRRQWQLLVALSCSLYANHVSAQQIRPHIIVKLTAVEDQDSDRQRRYFPVSLQEWRTSSQPQVDNLIDSGLVQVIARVRRDERDNQLRDFNGLPVDRVRHVIGESRLNLGLSSQLALTVAADADWTRRRLRSVAIDPRRQSSLVTSAAVGLSPVDGRWSATVRWRTNDAGPRRSDTIRAAAIMGGAMPEGSGWSMELTHRLRATRMSNGHIGIALTRWSMHDRDAAMLGGFGNRRDDRIVFNIIQRF